ncbi:hypothetical protein MPTK1_2g06920 [Marchantia polymorpha subsp. ruderalis]|uniref:Protein TIC 100 n=2 Tax=Marchantia polymorpha TaxID=3197 RepID=A0A176VGH9_MARPO|nr:hypothetical protein AXG93_4273s1270 [Marchantia polymorpha subsp. ruderalis]PTQ44297.1 hypothetical protein MARPO_0021s0145 [Marchantia polymorpha]BBN01371.1 hypothetical protein Mp_2g06920 [Marchantia polymorpha subsp. ruderalis]|eukprot:PTQ44297.1 hypothetical protein MARPO_0021s0145 [Marchantia polymorpha]
MADSDDEVPVLDGENEELDNSKKQERSQVSKEIPNFRGKVPDAEKEEGKGTLTVRWDEDDEDDEPDDEDYVDSDEEDEDAGAVGEEFAKARREAARLRREKRLEEEEAEAGSDDEDVIEEEDMWNFPVDEEKWTEADVGEEWADAWPGDDKAGFDPELVDDEEEVLKQWKEGGGPPRRPYYVPYRKHYPLIPEDHPDIQTPQDVVEELERYEEFLTWASYIFEDGSTYEGTVWDDLAHGRGVYTTALELCKYEGEWFQNAMEGHGVLEVDVPVVEPPPDSEAAKKLKAQGKLLQTDFMDQKDKDWLKLEIEDTLENEEDPIDPSPIEDSDMWVKQFGEKPERGHYRYSGQWKHNRMHGCGLYEVNGRQIWGKFYFGEMLPVPGECDEDQVAVHAGMAEIAAAKARMFVNKPDGMVREYKGPYSDPSHPYMYEEEDLWMAPGFINEFYPVPEDWQRYAEEVDEEQAMWLNSFIKSPLRIPMPPELEYQWQKDDEFVVLSNRDSDPMMQDPANLDPEVEGDILLHVPTGQLINWAEDKDGNLRFFVQPVTEDGVIRPELAVPLPLGFDEFMGEVDSEGNKIDESRRNLTIEERQKLEKEDKKKEKDRRLKEEIAEIERKESEKIKALEQELYVKDLENQLENALLEERFIAELEADDEDELTSPEVGEVDTATMKEDIEEVPSKDEEVEESVSNVEDAREVDQKQGDNSEDDGSEGDEDEEDKKPRSFGKVAMVSPEYARSCRQQVGAQPPPTFPTVFASISLMTQTAFKQVVESSLSSVQRVWSSKIHAPTMIPISPRISKMKEINPVSSSIAASPEIVKPVFLRTQTEIRCPRLYHTSRARYAVKLPAHKKMTAAQGVLSSFRSQRTSQRAAHSELSINQLGSRLQSTWTVPYNDVLSIAVPVQVLGA